MPSTTPLLIEDTNITNAWCRVLDNILNNSGKEISPVVVTITNFQESPTGRKILDDRLSQAGLDSIDTVAGTIFPESLYIYHDRNRQKLFDDYLALLPRIISIDQRNRRGTYFGRLINFNQETNQLETIISAYKANPTGRRTRLQAAIFDPKVDHQDGPYLGFPCLQHVTFSITKDRGLVVNGSYALQYLFQRAYGNWLGLVNLGSFMAKEMGLRLERFNCFIGIEQLDHLNKTEADALLKAMSS